ncbi:CheY-like chemotaxis protein, partial [Paraburkholderia terricola]|nr:CheY-like chemotaxis protein [Paraburkholderia terricola]
MRKVEQQEQRPVVLLADDDRLTAAAWTTVLRMNGFEVVWAPDGGSAWALARMGRQRWPRSFGQFSEIFKWNVRGGHAANLIAGSVA